MTYSRLQYFFGSLALGLLYALTIQGGGFRLPFYYAFDGHVFFVSEKSAVIRNDTIREIGGKKPDRMPVLFQGEEYVEVRTNEGYHYISTIPNTLLGVLYDFKFFIILSFIFLISGFWFLESGKDIHLAFLCFAITLFLYSLVISYAFHQMWFVYRLSFFIILPAMFNMALRTTGKEVPGALLLIDILAVIFLGFVTYVGQEDIKVHHNLEVLGLFLLHITLIVTVSLQLENALRRTEDPIENLKRWTLVGGSVAGFLLPLILYDFNELWMQKIDPSFFLFWMFLVYPFSLIYGTYRIQLVPFQLMLTSSILAGLLTVMFGLIYALVLLGYNLLVPDRSDGKQWIVHILFILILVFFLDPARRSLVAVLQKRVIRLGTGLTESLEKLARLISNPLNIVPTGTSFLKEISKTLEVKKVTMLISEGTFPGLKFKSDFLKRIPDESSVWDYFSPGKIIVTSYLTYAGGNRGELYRFLFHNRYYMAIGIPEPDRRLVHEATFTEYGDRTAIRGKRFRIKAALLIGNKEGDLIFKLSEIRYLQEAARLAGMLVYNYALLIQEVKKRKRMHELSMAGEMQRSLLFPADSDLSGVRTSFFNLPAISVTGDYLDIIELSDHSIAFLLGDVSGHGLGTGYLVSTFRSMIRSHLQNGVSLADTVKTLNQFLLERYRGDEFITLFALKLNTENGRMEYLNAAHPGPLIRKAESGKLIALDDSQRLLGILPTAYTSSMTVLETGDRLFLYSDGVTETFNQKDEVFGNDLLINFLEKHGEEPPQRITDRLQQTLTQFRGNESLSDDTSFMVIEYAPQLKHTRNLIEFFRHEVGHRQETGH